MIKTLTITAMMATPAFAHTLSSDPLLAGCVAMSEAAGAAMTYRQQPGATVAMALRGLDRLDEDDGVTALAQALIIAAFSQPSWLSEDSRQAAIADFANEVFALCMQKQGELM